MSALVGVANVRSRFFDELSETDQIALAEVFERTGIGLSDEIKKKLKTKFPPHKVAGIFNC